MTRVFTMTHKHFAKPEDPVYVPLQVGRAAHEDLGYLGDDTGDSISDLNCYYGELTGIYWVWKNYEGRENIGICHYRRFFINEKMELLKEADYEEILSRYDIITSKAMYADVPYQEYYAKAHHIEDLEEEGQVIKELFPDDYPVFCEVMQGKKHYFGNLMVTSRKLFDAYCSWLFAIFFELEKRIDVSSYDEYHKRVFGFLSEQLLLVWITARGLTVYESRVGISEEKAETKEFKLAIGQLIKMGQVTQARQMFYEILKVRPDIQLEHSDLKHEIPDIEQILYICELEEQNGIPGMMAYSKELPVLTEHLKKLRTLLEQEEWKKEAMDYFTVTDTSDIAVEVILRNDMNLKEDWKRKLEKWKKRK